MENNLATSPKAYRLHNQSLTQPSQEYVAAFNELLGNDAKTIALIVNCILLCCTIACFGVVANVINLHIFKKQGFDSTVNISLFGLAMSDLCALVTVLWLGVCMNPLLQPEQIALDEIEYLTAGWPHCLFARITCMITVYITIERFLCVAIPLKVKLVITKESTVVTVIVIFISQIMTAIPSYSSSYISWKFVPQKNMSVISLCRIENSEEIEFVSFVLQAIMQSGSFVLIIFFTALLVVKIRKKTKWRSSSASEIQKESTSVRDAKMVRMIVLIAVILIICFTPGMMCFTYMIIEPEYNVGGLYDNVFWVAWSITFVFQTCNSSVNILVYYNMSSRYRNIFNKTFFGCRTRLGLQSEILSLED